MNCHWVLYCRTLDRIKSHIHGTNGRKLQAFSNIIMTLHKRHGDTQITCSSIVCSTKENVKIPKLHINDILSGERLLTHWGRVTHICVSDLTNIGSDNGLSPARRQAIIWTTAGILLIEPLGTNFSEILIGIQIF